VIGRLAVRVAWLDLSRATRWSWTACWGRLPITVGNTTVVTNPAGAPPRDDLSSNLVSVLAICDSFIQDTTIRATLTVPFDGPNAEGAYGAAIGAGGPVPVSLYASTGSLVVESFYHVNSNKGVPLSSDLMSHFPGEGTFIPISNIDLGILQDSGIPVTANHTIYNGGVLIRGYCLRNDMTVVQLNPDSIDYFTREPQTHDVVFAEGLSAEGFLDCVRQWQRGEARVEAARLHFCP
jgi:hypothetical protein